MSLQAFPALLVRFYGGLDVCNRPVMCFTGVYVLQAISANVFVGWRRFGLEFLTVMQKSIHDATCVLAEVIQIIAAFLDDGHFPAYFEQLSGHVEVHQRADSAPSDLVVYRCVEAARYHDQVWCEFADHREE